MKGLAIMCVVAMTVLAPAATTDGQADFGGTWIRQIPDADYPDAWGPGLCGRVCTIRQDRNVIEITREDGLTRARYSVDGTERITDLAGGIRAGETATWRNRSIVITTRVIRRDGQAGGSVRVTLTIDAEGNLVISSDTPPSTGRPSKLVYLRKQ